MSRFAAAIVAASTLLASTAHAGPPALRPIDIETIHGLTEGSIVVARELRGEVPQTLAVRTIVIDPGHGGGNEGAVGVAEVHEKRLTLELAYELREALRTAYPDVTVVMTRYWDREVGLDERIQWANDVGADLFLSLHYNAATHDRAIGYETYFLADEVLDPEPAGTRRTKGVPRPMKRAQRLADRALQASHRAANDVLRPPHATSKLLAAHVQATLVEKLESTNRGVKAANFAVLRGAMMPAVVVEAGFLTHPQEGRDVLTPAHRTLVVEALVKAVGSFDEATRPASGTPVATAASASEERGTQQQ